MATVRVSRSAGRSTWAVLTTLTEDKRIVPIVSLEYSGQVDLDSLSSTLGEFDSAVELELPKAIKAEITRVAVSNLTSLGAETIERQALANESRRLSYELRVGMVYEMLDKHRAISPELFTNPERAYAVGYNLLRAFNTESIAEPLAKYVADTLHLSIPREHSSLVSLGLRLKRRGWIG
jgi:hypothetical protein